MVRRWLLIAAAAALLAANGFAAHAAGHATVTSAWGDILHSSWSGSAHSPDLWITWEHTVDDGATFDDVVEGDDAPGTFLVRCIADTLAYRGDWEEAVDYNHFQYLELDVELGCTLEVSEPVRVTMSRSVLIPLLVSDHRVDITGPGETTTTFLGDDPADLVEVDLAAGSYTIRLIVDMHYADSVGEDRVPPYDVGVTVSWADLDVAAAATSWSGVKQLFR